MSSRTYKLRKLALSFIPFVGEYLAYKEMKKYGIEDTFSKFSLLISGMIRPITLYEIAKNPADIENIKYPLLFYGGFTTFTDGIIFSEEICKSSENKEENIQKVDDFKL